MEYVELQAVNAVSGIQGVIAMHRMKGEHLIAAYPARFRSDGSPFAFYLFFSPIQSAPVVRPPA